MGGYALEPHREKHITQQQGDNMEFVAGQMQGWRMSMEDACIHKLNLDDGNALFAVFDGHGGFEISRFVASVFEKELKSNRKYLQKEWGCALDEVFKRIDQYIKSPQGQIELHKIRYNGQVKGVGEREFIGGSCGCTANVVLITPEQYIVANAGDSRSVLSRDGVAIALSKDHKPELEEEEARVKGAGGKIVFGRVNGGLNLTRSFGDFDYKRNPDLPYDKQMIICKPQIKEFKRQEKDQFILCGCDGIWQNYPEESQGLIERVIQKLGKEQLPVKQVMEEMLDSLMAADVSAGIGCDNMTAILIIFRKY